MQLSEFITTALEDIAKGLSDAQSHKRPGFAYVLPQLKKLENPNCEYMTIVNVDFDIALSSTTTGGASGGLQLFAIKASGDMSHENSAAHRVKISVPVAFPSEPNSIDH
ncbi:hypothetical protein Mal52_51150 [Symmachiella dynata]|uniref:Uncharacterized protein n=1 Tax=Symmachiella dynata TaxID=2527995 RepID=A0A517ZVT1_9PLAN|nr:hypothetical protein [Symmachiella dynata]QDU46593.1 hypothetical protein Mal52_51150 [Symmachiella dynata]